MLVAICRPSHDLQLREHKFLQTYKKMGFDALFIGNKRGMDPQACESKQYVGFSYPYYSKLMPLGTIAYAIRAANALDKVRPDIVHAGDLEGLLPGYLYKRFINSRCKLIYDIADSFSARYRIPLFFQNLVERFDEQLMCAADLTIIPQVNRADNFLYHKPNKLIVLPNCPLRGDAPPFTEFPKVPPLKVLLSGQMMWTRGIREIVSAAQAVHDVRILVVSGKYPPGVKEFLVRSGVVDLYDGMSQANVLLLARECHLIAALYEPSSRINRQAAPNKVYDAMAVGRPVLLNTEVEVSQFICEGLKCGIHAPYSDIGALANVFRRVLTEPGIFSEMGLRGQKLFGASYHWEAVESIFIESVLSASAVLS